MFKATLNMMKLNVKITPQTPLLVASGKTFDITSPDIQFIRMNTPYGETIYIPGSSIKGVLRGGLEAVLRENEKWKAAICCTSEKLCHILHRSRKDYRNKLPYKHHCPVCRMFGSGDLASHLEISDVFPFDFDDTDEKKKEKIAALQDMLSSRTGIKIDRKTGKTSPRALFEYEILGGGELFGEFTFTNYQLYQPGLLFMLFDLSNQGFLRYGHSKSRGLGVLNFTIQSMKILQMGQKRAKTLKGIAGLFQPGKEDNDYGFYMKDNDTIDKEFPCRDNIVYNMFHFTHTRDIVEITGLFREKVEKFLS